MQTVGMAAVECPAHVVEVDHRSTTVGVALPACGDTGLAADAAPGIDEQRALSHASAVPLPWGAVGGRSSAMPPASGTSGRAPGGTGGGAIASMCSPRSTRQAHTLNSGISEVGSRASTVMMFAAAAPAQ